MEVLCLCARSIDRCTGDDTLNYYLGARTKGRIDLGDDTDTANILEFYIQKKTSSGKKLADFYVGVIDSINNNDEAVAGEKCNSFIYNGIKVTSDLVKDAHSWLTLNGWGRPSSREKPLPEEPEMSREELIAAINAMHEEIGCVLVSKTEYERLTLLDKE